MSQEIKVQGTERAVCEDIAKRQQLGIAKYETTVRENPLTLVQWLQHAYEETLDQAVYLKRAIEEMEGKLGPVLNELDRAKRMFPNWPSDTQTTSQPQVGTTALFSPFEYWGDDMYGLCTQDGKITKEPIYEKRHTEWRIVKYGGGLWEVEVADEPEGYEVVYRGKIPSNRFLRELLSNLEIAPPLDGENTKEA